MLIGEKTQEKDPKENYGRKRTLRKEMTEWRFREIFKNTRGDPVTGMDFYVPRQWESVPQQIQVSAMDGEEETALWVTHYCNNEVQYWGEHRVTFCSDLQARTRYWGENRKEDVNYDFPRIFFFNMLKETNEIPVWP